MLAKNRELSYNIKNVPVVVYDEDQSALSRDIIQAFGDSESFVVTEYVSTEEEMQRALREKEVYMGIQVPTNFSKDVMGGGHASVLALINGSNIMFANTTSVACQDALNDFADKFATRQAALKLNTLETKLAPKIAPINYEYRVLNNPTQSYSLFFCIGLAMTAFQMCLYMVTCASVQYDFANQKEIKRTSLPLLLLGKFIFHWLVAVVAFTLFFVFATQVFFLPAKAELWQIYLLAALFIGAVISMAFLVSPLFDSLLSCIKLGLLYVVPSFILSGYTWPLESIEPILQYVAKIFFPITWVIAPLRDLFTSGTAPHLGYNCLVLILFILVNASIGYALFRRKLRA